MATAFSATKISGPHVIGPKLKVAFYKVQMPSASTEAGEALDLSSDFNYVYGASFGNRGVEADFGYKFSLAGTYSANGVVAAGLVVTEHMGSDSAAAFDIVAANTDLKAIDDMTMMVWGN